MTSRFAISNVKEFSSELINQEIEKNSFLILKRFGFRPFWKEPQKKKLVS